MTEIYTNVRKYTVSTLPDDHDEAYLFTVEVNWRGPGDRWAVGWMNYVYSKTGRQRYEPSNSGRTDYFQTVYRHSLEDALALAERVAPKIRVNGCMVVDGEIVKKPLDKRSEQA